MRALGLCRGALEWRGNQLTCLLSLDNIIFSSWEFGELSWDARCNFQAFSSEWEGEEDPSTGKDLIAAKKAFPLLRPGGTVSLAQRSQYRAADHPERCHAGPGV